mgnify:CR=1 FL=1
MEEQKNPKNVSELIAKEKQERFSKPWSKLDKGTKMNRLHLFIKKQKINNELNDDEEKQLKILLIRLFESGNLNKSTDIEYSIEDKEILNIKNLEFDGKKKYKFIIGSKKKKVDGGKSKSNIDRHFNRSKENKN